MKTTTYTLPAHWAPALINGDLSGMTDEEIDSLYLWISHEAPGVCIACSDDSEFRHLHDADGYALAGDCLTYTFTHYEETTA